MVTFKPILLYSCIQLHYKCLHSLPKLSILSSTRPTVQQLRSKVGSLSVGQSLSYSFFIRTLLNALSLPVS